MVSTWQFDQRIGVISSAVTAGPMEKNSRFASYFDEFFHEENNSSKSYEDLHSLLIRKSMKHALNKKNMSLTDISCYVGGDLINQMTPTIFSAKEFELPLFPVFSACATIVQATIQAALMYGHTKETIAIGTGSYHAAVERQFRYPIEYGSQKPDTAQWTVTAGVVALMGLVTEGPVITAGTIGRVQDEGLKNPYDMGSAMAPAAYDTISRHLQDTHSSLEDYDVIMTGDLGKYGLQILKRLLGDTTGVLQDAGEQFYGSETFCLAGGSGAGCSAAVYYTYVLDQLEKGVWNRVLLVATGALLSPLTYQQGKSIPVIAHAMEWRNL